MKKSTFLWVMLFCMVGTLFAQTPAEMSEIQAAKAVEGQNINVQNLLDRLAETPLSTMSDNLQQFTVEERIAIQQYYKSQNSTRLADIIPTAGATETFPVVVGDFFYDPSDGINGGPGGDCSTTSSGDPGDYPNCDCVTVTTLTAPAGEQISVEFNSFRVFGAFDWLAIFDGSGPVTATNASGSATNPTSGDPELWNSSVDGDELVDMINAGMTTFTSTNGSLTFASRFSGVVNTCGWEAEVVPAGGGGGGGGGNVIEAAYVFDAGFCSDEFGTFDVAGPYLIDNISTSATAIFAGDFAGDNTLYAVDNNTDELITINSETGAETVVAALTGLTVGEGISGLAWNANDGTMYALSIGGGASTLYTLDLTTAVLTPLGASAQGLAVWLAIDNDGNAYSATVDSDSLFSVNLSDGSMTLIGPLGININFAQDADFDPITNVLYMGAYIGGGANQWASVDTATGTATGLGAVDSVSGAGCGAELGVVAISAGINNDECAGATAMACGDVETGDTSTYTDTGGFNAAPDAWYSYTGSGDAEFVTFSLCDGGTTYDSRLTVFDSCGGAQIAGNDDFCGLQSEVSFLSDGSTTYYVAVEGFGAGNAGAFSLEVSCNPVAANDLCDDAIAVACGDMVMGSTTFATNDSAVAANCDDTFDPTPFNPTVDVTAPGVWYTYQETIPGFIQDITVDLCDAANYDTKISVYSGDCGTLTCVAANDDNDDCTGFTSTVEFQSDGVSTYYILVHGFGTQTGDFTLSFDCAPVPPPNDMIANSIDVDEIGFPYTDPAVNMPGATLEAGTPADCDNAGVNGVWYNFVPEMSGEATATVTNPVGYTSVTFYTADSEDAVETDLTLVDYFDNQCVPGADASILVIPGQAYYVYVANTMGVTDIVIDGDFFLGIGDADIAGFNYYPNPATDALTLNAGAGTIESVVIYNILGQEVLSQEIGSNNAELNVSGLTVGTYILKVVVDGELGIYKIVKQ